MPTNKSFAAVSTLLIGTAMLVTPASAHCSRHIYNNSTHTWHVQIQPSSYPNLVDYDIPPGGNIAFQHVTDGKHKQIIFMQIGLPCQARIAAQCNRWLTAGYEIEGCYIVHWGPESRTIPQITLNEPADGDAQLND